MLHFHGTPISPRAELLTLAGRCFCVSYAAPQDVEVCHDIGQSVMLDNGAFSFWRTGKPTDCSSRASVPIQSATASHGQLSSLR